MEDHHGPAMSSVAKLLYDVEKTMMLRFRGWERDLPHQGEKGG